MAELIRPENPAESDALVQDVTLAGAADEDDLLVLAQVIADAFQDLPLSRWLIADAEARQAIFPPYFRLFVEHAMATGVVHTTPDSSAVALWIPVRDEPPGPPPGYAERLAAITTPWIDRFVAFDEVLNGSHPRGVPHHHLAVLAVRPDRQGLGVGSAMLRAYHSALDERGIPAYLEASSLRSRELYLRNGYADRGNPIRLPDGPAMYPMWRPAPGLGRTTYRWGHGRYGAGGRSGVAAGQAGPRAVPAAARRHGRRHQAGRLRGRVGSLGPVAAGRARPGSRARYDCRGALRAR